MLTFHSRNGKEGVVGLKGIEHEVRSVHLRKAVRCLCVRPHYKACFIQDCLAKSRTASKSFEPAVRRSHEPTSDTHRL